MKFPKILTSAELSELEALDKAATQGTWAWFGNTRMQHIYLATIERGRKIVMDFARWGMQRAQPRFQKPPEHGFMDGVEAFVRYEADHREDIGYLDHPDARLLVEARNALPTLLRMAREREALVPVLDRVLVLLDARVVDGVLSEHFFDMFKKLRAEAVAAASVVYGNQEAKPCPT